PFDTGFTHLAPLPTVGGFMGNRFHLSGATSFIPTQAGFYTVGIQLSEYRFSTSLVQWIRHASVMGEFLIQVVPNCDSAYYDWGFAEHPVRKDTITAECWDAFIFIETSSDIDNVSVASDGSDFELIAPSGSTVPIVSASFNPALLPRTIQLTFSDTLKERGFHKLYLKKGSDGNILINECGIESLADTLYVKVANCHFVKQTENEALKIDVFPNPASGNLSIIHKRDISVTILSTNGQIILESKLYGTDEQIDISGIPNGIFFVCVKDTHGHLLGTSKIIKQ
ncbi:MAG: T9SS type A sorting domain-containing protein, partial [Bacteroidota bacterium]